MNSRIKGQPLSFLEGCLLTVPYFVAAGSGCAFFFPTSSAYEQTPDDPQKAVGYFFIAAFSFLIALLAGLGTLLGLSAFRPPLTWTRTPRLLLTAFILIGFAAYLFISLPAS